MKCHMISALTVLVLSGSPVMAAETATTQPATTQPAESPQTQPAKEVYREAPSVVTLNRQSFTIPAPEGFRRATSEQKGAEELLDALTAASAQRVVSFISSEPLEYIDNMPHLDQYHSVQVSKELLTHNLTVREFQQITAHMKTQLQQTMDKLKETNPGMMDRVSDFRTQKSGSKVNVEFPAMVALPPHVEEARLQSHTVITTHTINDEKEGTYTYRSVSTISVVHVNGQMLLLATFAPVEQMTWAQDINVKWARAVLVANPSAVAKPVTSN